MDATLLEILACPQSKEPLHWDKDSQELIAITTGVAYPIEDGIPVLLADSARKLSSNELDTWLRKLRT